jgi:hypothetical protein
VGFVPIERERQGDGLPRPAIDSVGHDGVTLSEAVRAVTEMQQHLQARMRDLDEFAANLGLTLSATNGRKVGLRQTTPDSGTDSSPAKTRVKRRTQKDAATNKDDTAKKKPSRST